MNHSQLTARLYRSKESRIKRFFKEIFIALGIVTIGFIVAAILAFAACFSRQQCTDNTIEIYHDNGYAEFGFPYNTTEE